MKRKIAIACGIVLFFVAIAVVIDCLPRPQGRQIDFGQLIPRRVTIPAESNGVALLYQAAKLLSVSNSDISLATYTNWNRAAATNLLERNRAALEVLHEAWARPLLQVDEVTNSEADYKYLGDWRHLAVLAIVAAHLSFSEGKEQEAFAQVMNVARYGQKLEDADGATIHYMVGDAIKTMALDCMQHFTTDTSLSASNLNSISHELTDFEARPTALRQSLRIEYLTSTKILDGISTNPVGYFPYIYSPDRTKEELAVRILSVMDALTNCYAKGITAIPVVQTNRSYFRRLLHGNLVGTVFNEMIGSTYSGTLVAKCSENTRVRGMRIVLALKVFQMQNNRPAKSLEELVPDYLEAVPLDDFDGKPLRYSTNLNVVYSVGPGLIDLGGKPSTNAIKRHLVFPLK